MLFLLEINSKIPQNGYFYTENFQIKNSDVRFLVYKEYCAEIQKWLVESGIVVTKENIMELMLRIEKEIEKSFIFEKVSEDDIRIRDYRFEGYFINGSERNKMRGEALLNMCFEPIIRKYCLFKGENDE